MGEFRFVPLSLFTFLFVTKLIVIFHSEKALEAMKRNLEMGADPSNPREPNTPVGLKVRLFFLYFTNFI